MLLKRGLFAVSICLIAFNPFRVSALGLRIPNQDAEAIGRGNAFAATADNPSALYYNPAGITQLEGQNIQVGLLNYFGINSDYHSPTGSSSQTDYELVPVPQVYYAFSLKDTPLSFGLGIYAPFGLGLEWPEDTGFRTLSIEGRLNYATINPVIAWKILPTLSVAVGPTFNYSKLKLTRGLFNPVPDTDYFKFDGDDFAFGFNAGILWQPHPKWSFGVNYRSATTVNYEGTSSYTGLPSTTATAQFDFPQIVAGGISFRPTDRWNIEVDLDWTDWSTLKTVVFKNTPLAPELPFTLDWQSSFMVEVGATYRFPAGFFISAGYFFSENSTSEEFFTPTVPDTNLHTVSVGGGYKGEHWYWALSGQLITGPWRTVSGSVPSPAGQTADGQYQFLIPTASASIGFHF
ncbi:MAG TPA: outer membrane protein transport protein [Candidatus Nitrosotalea sp.]|nr:outer membrane protein transport protein [Candidatus Nitrosotalea sp.]